MAEFWSLEGPVVHLEAVWAPAKPSHISFVSSISLSEGEGKEHGGGGTSMGFESGIPGLNPKSAIY